jgi:IS4 transposase
MFSISRFHRIMQGVPRGTFASLVERHDGDKHSKGFSCFNLLMAQVFGHLSGSGSLRDIETGFNEHRSHHYHLDTGPLRRSTLADAGKKRNPAVFEALARVLMKTASRQVRRRGAECLLLLDSTSFTLKGRGFDDWAAAHRTRNTQGLKLHLVIDAGGTLPVWQTITAANVNDVSTAADLPLQRDATYVFDKGYCDYTWWARFDDQDAHFVTRLKRNASVDVVKTRPLPADAPAILADEIIRFANKHPRAGRRNHYTAPLRRITVDRPDHDTPLVLVTNDMNRPASAVADCYKARWQIELFFKWIKQNLRIKQFFGRSENAVRIQILCALIAYLLLAIYRNATAPDTSLLRVLSTLRVGLFQRPAAEAASQRRRQRARLAQLAVQPGLFT